MITDTNIYYFMIKLDNTIISMRCSVISKCGNLKVYEIIINLKQLILLFQNKSEYLISMIFLLKILSSSTLFSPDSIVYFGPNCFIIII